MGAAIMNPLIFGVLVLIINGLALAWRVVHEVPWLEALGSVQSPGVLFIPYLFLLQGTSLVAARLFFLPNTSSLATVLGAVVLAACVASQVLIYYYIVRQVPFAVKYVPDPRVGTDCCESADWIMTGQQPDGVKQLSGWRKRVYVFVFGDSVAVSIDESSFFAERWSHVCDPYRPKCAVFVCLEGGQMIAISLLSVWQPSSHGECCVRNFSLCLMLLAFAAILLYVRPFKATMDNVLSCLVAVMMSASMTIMAIGTAADAESDSGFFSSAGYLLLATAAIAFAKGVWDVGLYVFDLYIERRSLVRSLDRLDIGKPEGDNISVTKSGDDFDSLKPEHCLPRNVSRDLFFEGPPDLNPLSSWWRSASFIEPAPNVARSASHLHPMASYSPAGTPLSPSTLFARDSRYSVMSDPDSDADKPSPPAGRRWLSRTPGAPKPPPAYISPGYADHLEFFDIDLSGTRSYRSFADQSDLLSSRSLRGQSLKL
ncbi:hypothetical protein DIPPA_07936 [Diplonema papillatum]|nr:hypothetical protein DIPPA_07936 [Diplonema papillatum]